jgi:hypothetical protein
LSVAHVVVEFGIAPLMPARQVMLRAGATIDWTERVVAENCKTKRMVQSRIDARLISPLT